MKYDSPEELADKVAWEGGLLDAIIDYGIPPADLPAGTPVPVIGAWARIYNEVPKLLEIIEDWLPAI